MCIFTEFFKDYDFRSSGMAKTGCKMFISTIFFSRDMVAPKKTFNGMVTALKI